MKPFRTVLLPVALLLVVVIGDGAVFGLFQHRTNTDIAARIVSLESQVTTLATALKESNLLSEENKENLQEIVNRRNVIAQSQEDLLTASVARATPAVVSIVISKDVPLLEVQYVNPFGNDPLFQNFGFRVPTYRQVGTEKQQVGAGTGFFVRPNGYIVTNRHVVADTNAEYVVLLSSGEQKTAEVVYRDPDFDLAVLKIPGTNYTALPFGNSSELKLGQTVAAIGNALGEYNNSVSVGIVSGLNRSIQAQDASGSIETLEGVIQTDAAINPGNSGGPLIDLDGRAIGVNVAMERGANSIGFAIPADTARNRVQRALP